MRSVKLCCLRKEHWEKMIVEGLGVPVFFVCFFWFFFFGGGGGGGVGIYYGSMWLGFVVLCFLNTLFPAPPFVFSLREYPGYCGLIVK